MKENDSTGVVQDEKPEADSDSRIYELGYLLVPTIAEEDVSVHYGNLKELVASVSGEVVSDEMPKMMNLAYPMYKVLENVRTKFDSAYFGWIKFQADPEKVLVIKKQLDLDVNFLRFLIIKTVKENTIASRKFMGDRRYHRGPVVKKYTEKVEPAVPIDKAEVDKEIEALVAD